MVASAGLTAPSFVSAAPGDGSISGTVLDPLGSELADVCVSVDGIVAGVTDPNGTYSLANVPAGSHRVGFTDCAATQVHAAQWYLGASDQFTATPVDVIEGHDTQLSDVSMQLGVSVTGRVTDTAGGPLEGVPVSLDTADLYPTGTTVTDADGNYRTAPVPDGDYQLRFGDFVVPAPHAVEYWNDTHLRSEATVLSLRAADGGEVNGFDAQLTGGAGIAGHVSNADGVDLGGMCVSAHTPNAQGSERLARTITDATGNYSLNGLPPLPTHVQFHECTLPGQFVEQWYGGAPTLELSARIDLRTGSAIVGVDATMGLRPELLPAPITPEPTPVTPETTLPSATTTPSADPDLTRSAMNLVEPVQQSGEVEAGGTDTADTPTTTAPVSGLFVGGPAPQAEPETETAPAENTTTTVPTTAIPRGASSYRRRGSRTHRARVGDDAHGCRGDVDHHRGEPPGDPTR